MITVFKPPCTRRARPDAQIGENMTSCIDNTSVVLVTQLLNLTRGETQYVRYPHSKHGLDSVLIVPIIRPPDIGNSKMDLYIEENIKYQMTRGETHEKSRKHCLSLARRETQER